MDADQELLVCIHFFWLFVKSWGKFIFEAQEH